MYRQLRRTVYRALQVIWQSTWSVKLGTDQSEKRRIISSYQYSSLIGQFEAARLWSLCASLMTTTIIDSGKLQQLWVTRASGEQNRDYTYHCCHQILQCPSWCFPIWDCSTDSISGLVQEYEKWCSTRSCAIAKTNTISSHTQQTHNFTTLWFSKHLHTFAAI